MRKTPVPELDGRTVRSVCVLPCFMPWFFVARFVLVRYLAHKFVTISATQKGALVCTVRHVMQPKPTYNGRSRDRRAMSEDYIYKRVLLKLSGEALAGSMGYGIDPSVVNSLAQQIHPIVNAGVQLAVVIGGGNIFRGMAGSAEGMDRAQADYIGMLATVMNALALQDAFERHGIFSRVQSAINMQEVSEPFIRRRAIRHLEKGRVVILAAGTGNPYFTTDTTAALRACELDCDCLLKATKVDGIYESDPVKNPSARRFDRITYREVLTQNLHVMDATATSLCMDNNMPLVVFNLMRDGNIARVLKGEAVGTTVYQNDDEK